MIRPHMSLFGTAPAPFEKKFQKIFILAFDVKNSRVSLSCTFFWILVYCVKIRSDGCHCSQWSFQKEKRQKISTESGKKNEMQFSWHTSRCVSDGSAPFLISSWYVSITRSVNKNLYQVEGRHYEWCSMYVVDDVWNSKHIF